MRLLLTAIAAALAADATLARARLLGDEHGHYRVAAVAPAAPPDTIRLLVERIARAPDAKPFELFVWTLEPASGTLRETALPAVQGGARRTAFHGDGLLTVDGPRYRFATAAGEVTAEIDGPALDVVLLAAPLDARHSIVTGVERGDPVAARLDRESGRWDRLRLPGATPYVLDAVPVGAGGHVLVGARQARPGGRGMVFEDVWVGRVDDAGTVHREASFGGRNPVLLPAGDDTALLVFDAATSDGAQVITVVAIGADLDTRWRRVVGSLKPDKVVDRVHGCRLREGAHLVVGADRGHAWTAVVERDGRVRALGRAATGDDFPPYLLACLHGDAFVLGSAVRRTIEAGRYVNLMQVSVSKVGIDERGN